MIRFACPHCHTAISLAPEHIAQQFKCEKCQQMIMVPKAPMAILLDAGSITQAASSRAGHQALQQTETKEVAALKRLIELLIDAVNIVIFLAGIPIGIVVLITMDIFSSEVTRQRWKERNAKKYGPEGMGGALALFWKCGWITVGLGVLGVGVVGVMALFFSSSH